MGHLILDLWLAACEPMVWWGALQSLCAFEKRRHPQENHSDVNMVKQKNHTARNNTVKAHRNGIKKPKNHRYHSTRGVRS